MKEYLFALAAATQIAALGFIGVTSYTAVYVPIVAARVGCAIWARQRTMGVQPLEMAPAGAVVLVAITVPFQSNPGADSVGALALLPVVILPGLVVLLLREPLCFGVQI